MILDIQKEKLKVLKDDFSFIKECLWPGKFKFQAGRFEKTATFWRFLQ